MFVYDCDVYVEDVDLGAIVYHANYLKYAERARTQWLQALGFNLVDLLQQDILFVVKNAQIDYHSPARLSDHIAISCQLIGHSRTSLQMSQKVYKMQHTSFNPADDKLLCDLNITLVCVKHNIKPQPVPLNIIQGLQS